MKLRKYQKPMFKAACAAIDTDIKRSSYYAATGAGKTEVFKAIIQHLFNVSVSAKVLVVHPRIALSLDQQERFSREIEVPYTSFHSGEVLQSTTRDSVVNIKNVSTTSVEKIASILEEQSDNNHIVFTTYHSLPKIASMDFDLIICDEAHYLSTKQHAPSLGMFKGTVMFFTATPVTSSMDFSMDAIEQFGPVLGSVTPASLIDGGYLVEPRLYWTKITTNQKGNHEDLTQSIAQTFVSQASMVHEDIPHKMLVAMPDTSTFDGIMSQISDLRAITGQDVDLYYVTAGMNSRNGTRIKNRDELLRQFKESSIPSIILHCDTLAEGIDIDGLTGAYIMRGLSQAKFVQTLGRVLRPWKEDFTDAGMPRAFSKRKKQFGLVNVAVVDGELRGSSDIMKWYEALQAAEYNSIPVIFGSESTFGSNDGDGELIEKVQSRILDIEFELASESRDNQIGW